MSSLFISDLHLSPEQPELTQQAIDFLNQHTQGVDNLYILGDLFNTWLGDDIAPEEFKTLVDTLSSLSQSGMNIFLMVGNRDFMLGQQFADRCGCSLITDPTLIKLGNKNVLLMHGDSLCIDDVSYQRYRRWTRNRFLQWCFLALPASRRQAISDKIKQKSREQKQQKSAMIMDVNQQVVIETMKQFGVDYLLHGHTHRPAIHPLAASKYRIVLGDWGQYISYVKYANGELQLIDPRLTGGVQDLSLA
jgi:UDP-2,3-diacylglucosamine hydrolase